MSLPWQELVVSFGFNTIGIAIFVSSLYFGICSAARYDGRHIYIFLVYLLTRTRDADLADLMELLKTQEHPSSSVNHKNACEHDVYCCWEFFIDLQKGAGEVAAWRFIVVSDIFRR
jgi:hypothetical protein